MINKIIKIYIIEIVQIFLFKEKVVFFGHLREHVQKNTHSYRTRPLRGRPPPPVAKMARFVLTKMLRIKQKIIPSKNYFLFHVIK